MLRRVLFMISLLALALATTAHGALRSPQVPVSGTALQAFFTSQGQAINVNTDQLDLQTVSLPADATIQFGAPLVPPSSTSTLGIYNAGLGAPPLYQVFPGAASTGWLSLLAFRTAPIRAVVTLFDAGGAFQGSTTYLGADRSYLGFYLQLGTGDVLYGQDARNAGGAKLLAFNATGARAGSTWFAWETGAGPGGDFADTIWLLQYAFAPVAVLRTDWGTLKQRFH